MRSAFLHWGSKCQPHPHLKIWGFLRFEDWKTSKFEVRMRLAFSRFLPTLGCVMLEHLSKPYLILQNRWSKFFWKYLLRIRFLFSWQEVGVRQNPNLWNYYHLNLWLIMYGNSRHESLEIRQVLIYKLFNET